MFGQPAAGTSPFGQASTSTPFGAPAATPATNAFGSPAPTAPATGGFGQPATGGFGQPAAPAFGAPAAAPSAFGAPAPATGGFGASSSLGVGGFGSPAPAPAGFGAAATPSTPFGVAAPAPATGGLFGAPAAAPATGGLFGAPAPAAAPFGQPAAPATGGLFGAPAPAPAPGGFGFGAPTPAPAPAFGAAAAPATGGLFGAPAPAPATGGLFGAPAPAAAPTGGGLFGAPAAAPASGGLFGSPAPAPMGGAAGAGRGSLLVPFQATRKADGTSNITFQSISGMPQYENKSFEELRLEDYMAGNKGSQGQVATPTPATSFGNSFGAPAAAPVGGGLFGAPAPAPAAGGFGFGAAPPTPAPAAGGLFGSPAPAPFGAPAPAPATGGLFGAPAPAPATGGLFGAPAPAPAGGLFGAPAPAPATGGLFGATPAAPAAPVAGGLFGSPAAAPVGGGLFGAPAAAPGGGLFGAPAAAPKLAGGGLFGAPAAAPTGGGLFGAAPAAPVAGGLFGSPAAAPPGGGLFGAPAAAPAAGGGLFGAPAAAPVAGGLFGAPAAAPVGGGLFGSSAQKPVGGGLFGAPAAAQAGGGLFGAPAAAPGGGGLFGAPAAAPMAPAAVSATTILVPPAAETLLAQQMAAIENQNKELAVLEAWRGGNVAASKKSGNGSTGSVIPTSIYQRDAQAVRYRGLAGSTGSSSMNMNGNGSATVSILESYQSAPRSSAKIRPRGFGPTIAKSGLGQKTTKGMLSPSSFLGSSTKQLVIKPGALTPKPKTRLLLSDEAVSERKQDQTTEVSPKPSDLIRGRSLENVDGDTPASKGRDRGLLFEDSRIAADKPGFVSPDANAQQERVTPHSTSNGTPIAASSSKSRGLPTARSPVDESYDFYKSVIGSPVVDDNAPSAFGSPVAANGNKNSSIPKLTKDGYDMTPSLSELAQMSEADLAAVPNFVVERVGFGSVAWDGAVDVRNIDLDSVVSIEAKAVEVYHKEEETGSKPAVGIKLNRPAILTLHNVYPKSGPDASDAEKEKFERKIAKKTKQMGASLVLYDADIGVWKLHVEHFSRYALDDDSDDDEDEVQIVESEDIEDKSDFESGARGGRAPYNQVSWAKVEAGHTRFNVPENDDDDEMQEEESNLVLTNNKEGQRMQAAEAAYAELSQLQDADIPMEVNELEEEEIKTCYVDEGAEESDYIPADVFFPETGKTSNISICAQIAKRCNVKKATSSATDFGMRMGRSFNVCWRPDGSFLHPGSIDAPQLHGNKTLIQSRPIIDSGIPDEHKLLSTHLKHSAKLTEDLDFPIFSLVHENGEVLEDFDKAAQLIANKEENKDDGLLNSTSEAFSLISTIFGNVNANDTFEGTKRKDQAFKTWLQNICAIEVKNSIAAEHEEGNHYEAIFAALSGNDISKAASLAREYGHNMLALLITNSNNSSGLSLLSQMSQWQKSGAINHFPPELLRSYSLLTKDLSIERDLYQAARSNSVQSLDWKRRMLMLLKSMDGDTSNDGSICSVLVKQYEAEVSDQVAPPPTAWFRDPTLQNASSESNCTLFRLMQVFNSIEGGESMISLASVISPAGHNPNEFDFSTSFHLASVISALGVCEDLTVGEEFSLLDSFSSQLQSKGLWEWAVYVSLCCIKNNPSVSNIERKKRTAIDIISKHYTVENNSEAKQKRAFLEKQVGVPTEWFTTALSISAIHKFDVNKFIQHSTSTSTSEALEVYEENILPEVLFNKNRGSSQDIIAYLEAMGTTDITNVPTFRGAVYDYLILLRDVSEFLNRGDDDMDIDMDATYQHLLERTKSVQRSLLSLKDAPLSSWKLFTNQSLVPKAVILTELTSSLSVVFSQLQDSMAGKVAPSNSIETHTSAFSLRNESARTSTALSAYSCSNDDFMFHELDSKDALRGKYKLVRDNFSVDNGLVYTAQHL